MTRCRLPPPLLREVRDPGGAAALLALLALPLALRTVGGIGPEHEDGGGDDGDASAVIPDALSPCPVPTVPTEDTAWDVFDDVAAIPRSAEVEQTSDAVPPALELNVAPGDNETLKFSVEAVRVGLDLDTPHASLISDRSPRWSHGSGCQPDMISLR